MVPKLSNEAQYRLVQFLSSRRSSEWNFGGFYVPKVNDSNLDFQNEDLDKADDSDSQDQVERRSTTPETDHEFTENEDIDEPKLEGDIFFGM
ncbi:hypothetical protein FQR65_LT13792 [Abscondita terminalis]|nr:hypothetical protein FQR65_LT13792 [Abscondita terminalis]